MSSRRLSGLVVIGGTLLQSCHAETHLGNTQRDHVKLDVTSALNLTTRRHNGSFDCGYVVPSTYDWCLNLLHEMLQTAIEVEWGVIQPYLSAYYSIHEGASSNASTLLREVLVQEMFHMGAAANVLNAVGGHPSLDGSSFAPEYPMFIQYLNMSTSLAPFSMAQMLQFRSIEEAPWGPDQPEHTIGAWYQKILEVMSSLVVAQGEAKLFNADTRRQVNFTAGGATLPAVLGYKDAKEAIEGILHQGEGYDQKFWNLSPYTGEMEHPHYYRFEEVVKGAFYLSADQGHEEWPSGAKLDTDWTAVHNFLPNPKAADFKNHSDIYNLMTNFNSCYSLLLTNLHQSFNGEPERFMSQVGTMFMITRLARVLISTPAPGHPGFTVGAPWEWVNISDPNVAPCPSLMLSDDVVLV